MVFLSDLDTQLEISQRLGYLSSGIESKEINTEDNLYQNNAIKTNQKLKK